MPAVTWGACCRLTPGELIQPSSVSRTSLLIGLSKCHVSRNVLKVGNCFLTGHFSVGKFCLSASDYLMEMKWQFCQISNWLSCFVPFFFILFTIIFINELSCLSGNSYFLGHASVK